MVWTADGISAIHSAGVPWYLSIPLVALGVNFSFRLPIQYYTRSLVVRRNELNPLVSAWSSRHAASVTRGNDEQAERLWRLRVAGLTEKSPPANLQDLGCAAVEDACAVPQHGAVCGRFRVSSASLRRAHGLAQPFHRPCQRGQGVGDPVGHERPLQPGAGARGLPVVRRPHCHGPLLRASSSLLGSFGTDVVGSSVKGPAAGLC